ncbi:hypothetical protein BURPS406E_K0045 [Burkholderia pseudomallei 406e]|uniref:Uncharacterized protein n=2 Tax=Burkholderia pseudomallei TaxID=28450 RepID=A0A0E1W787_BURPE|nr:hypothetical protein BMASAVP1_A0783 [Burkholderia mallei SAVP1]ABN84738.1 hypothetical protein BURPS668_2997 [Burkholderia pseudomallei 668]ABN89110.1 hypothetical protein BURPS1106A_3051 [Burkholderia pseudomallei 1106a]ABO06492.1 hypothetical protein BMA10247_1997 [Burkholderia mallei NCTC 10247]AFR16938.1 hypothetical protein BPC006_I3091 [Burkholderia pseudomallei BPC006]EBA48237.1 hypothetical protein BURPS305_3815 [Burkholderia pseudomallei 305]EDK53720.1 hypothetical protein BMAFMH_
MRASFRAGRFVLHPQQTGRESARAVPVARAGFVPARGDLVPGVETRGCPS